MRDLRPVGGALWTLDTGLTTADLHEPAELAELFCRILLSSADIKYDFNYKENENQGKN